MISTIKVNAASILAISASGAELWVKLVCAAVPAMISSGYILWKWRRDSKEKKH